VVRVRVVRGLAALAVLLLLASVWPRLRAGIAAHPYFAVREVLVRDARRLAADRVREAAGIVPGMSVWDVDVAAAEQRLAAHPWIRGARVRRDLPHRVVIAVREHRPVAIVAVTRPRPALFYVAAHGRIFAPVGEADAHDFPFVTGLEPDDLAAGSTVGPRALRRALALLRAAGGAPGGLDAVSEVHVDPVRGLTLMPVRPAVPIELGWGGWEAKLARIAPVLKRWAGRESEIAGITLVFGEDVIVRTRGGKPEAQPKRAART
jgi:cell division protein FtsQ